MNNGKRVNKLSKKYYTLVFGVIMGSIMSVLTSLAVTIINIGIVHNFFEMWFGRIFDDICNWLSYDNYDYPICKEYCR
jgi:hypothetical protein